MMETNAGITIEDKISDADSQKQDALDLLQSFLNVGMEITFPVCAAFDGSWNIYTDRENVRFASSAAEARQILTSLKGDSA